MKILGWGVWWVQPITFFNLQLVTIEKHSSTITATCTVCHIVKSMASSHSCVLQICSETMMENLGNNMKWSSLIPSIFRSNRLGKRISLNVLFMQTAWFVATLVMVRKVSNRRSYFMEWKMKSRVRVHLYVQIFSSATFTPIWLKGETLKAYKSLEAYNYFYNGHVRTVYCYAHDRFVIMKAKVNPRPIQHG